MKKRILFASLAAYPLFNRRIHEPYGGAELDLYGIATHLDRSKFDVHFIVGDYGQERFEIHSDVTVHRGQVISDSGFLKGILNFFRLFFLVWKIHPDIIFTEATGWLTVELIFFKILLGKKIVFRSAHENNINGFTDSRSYGWLYRKLLPFIDYFLLQNNQDKNLFMSNFKYNGKTHVIRNLQNIPGEAPLPHSQRAHILWVGRSNMAKNPELFIEIARILPDKKFVMIMPNTNEGMFRKIERAAHKEENIAFIPGVSRDEILPYFQKALYLVSTSIKEGFPNVLVEAMKYGTPVISARLDYDTILTEKKCGIVAGDSAEKIASFIRCTDEKMWKSYSQNARAFALDNFNLSKGIQEYERIFLQL